MRFSVRNLGSVRRADIELKPLTIFVGPNNAGKTWLAYTLAGFLGEYGQSQYTRFLISSNSIQETYPPLDSAIRQFLDEGSATINLVQFAEQYADVYFKRSASHTRHWLQDYLGTKRRAFKQLSLDINIADMRKVFFDQISDYSVDAGFPQGQPLLRAVKNADNPILYFYAEEKIAEKLPPQQIRSFLLDNVFKAFHAAIYSNVYIFPTERTTLISLISGMRLASISTTPNEPNPGVQFPPVQAPLGYFVNMIGNLLSIKPLQRLSEADDPSIGEYMSLASLLERGILSGEIENASSALDVVLMEFLFKPAKDVSLEMQISSSMVKELSPFVLYLRYLAKPGQLLVIDEPEMNLHPLAQVRFMELLAMLVNAGLNILFTTHSTFMVDHLVNLIKAKGISEQEDIQNKFFLGSSNAFLSKDQVSVYLFEKREAHNILHKDGSIDWGTFSNVSSQVQGIFLDLVEREVSE
ncbi:MAG TPA: AAA family ATPase [Ktedonobacteraceae bacterium]|nr:AAA family ATPase [Ktedonobacteraceae bacterium]